MSSHLANLPLVAFPSAGRADSLLLWLTTTETIISFYFISGRHPRMHVPTRWIWIRLHRHLNKWITLGRIWRHLRLTWEAWVTRPLLLIYRFTLPVTLELFIPHLLLTWTNTADHQVLIRISPSLSLYAAQSVCFNSTIFFRAATPRSCSCIATT